MYANSITRTDTDVDSRADVEREIHFLKGYTWLEVLQNDERAVFTAASHAQRAADFLNRL